MLRRAGSKEAYKILAEDLQPGARRLTPFWQSIMATLDEAGAELQVGGLIRIKGPIEKLLLGLEVDLSPDDLEISMSEQSATNPSDPSCSLRPSNFKHTV